MDVLAQGRVRLRLTGLDANGRTTAAARQVRPYDDPLDMTGSGVRDGVAELWVVDSECKGAPA